MNKGPVVVEGGNIGGMGFERCCVMRRVKMSGRLRKHGSREHADDGSMIAMSRYPEARTRGQAAVPCELR
jgi:hypothetical protein